MSAIERFYTDGHIIERATSSSDDFGEHIKTWATHLTIRGKLWSEFKSKETPTAKKRTLFSGYKFACDLGNDITEEDRYKDSSGEIYNIVDVAERTRPDGTGHMELLLELVR